MPWGQAVAEGPKRDSVFGATALTQDHVRDLLRIGFLLGRGLSSGLDKIASSKPTSGVFDPESDATPSSTADAVAVTKWGNMLFRGENAWQQFLAGPAGRVLQSGGENADPTWGDTDTLTYDELVELASGSESAADDLERRFRLLVRAWVTLGLPPPEGLEHDIEAALST